MSYCRFGEGDVYIFLSTSGLLECCGCILQQTEWVDDDTRPIIKGYLKSVGEIIQTTFDTTQGMLDHLLLHRENEHYIPESCIQDLIYDQDENDQFMKEYQNKVNTINEEENNND